MNLHLCTYPPDLSKPAMTIERDESMKQAGTISDDDDLSPPENEEGDERSHSNNSAPGAGMEYCTFAVTGAVASFQPIFICHDCFREESSPSTSGGNTAVPLCICQACADICHGSHDGSHDHDVEYVGMGPCYCDCDHVGKCSIFQKSQVQAEKLLGTTTTTTTSTTIKSASSSSSQAETSASSPAPTLSHQEQTETATSTRPLQEAFVIPSLQSATISAELVVQAQELIRHSKETFWVDSRLAAAAASHQNDQSFCALEQLAWKICEHHLQHYGESLSGFFGEDGGAEWWVQVKDPCSLSGKHGAVDLHYDKDEALAEVFGLGSFPTLSTVTYLSESTSAQSLFNPTIVLDHTYAQGEDDLIDTMLVSKPSLGKHLVFDGKLLHGAPAHQDLRTTSIEMLVNNNNHRTREEAVRVTFLVNIWKQQPANVQPLPNEIRDALLGKMQPMILQNILESSSDPIAMTQKKIPIVMLEKDEDLPEHLRHRIELPFVSKAATWEDQLIMKNKDEQQDNDSTNAEEDNDDGGLVVVTFPPPPSTGKADDDTMIVQFRPGLQAYLDYPQRESSSEDQKMGEMQYETGYI